jgi:hypothetical protein
VLKITLVAFNQTRKLDSIKEKNMNEDRSSFSQGKMSGSVPLNKRLNAVDTERSASF